MNGMVMGEIGISAALAGYYRVPVALVTGDDKTVREARRLLGKVETVEVKKGIGMYAGLCISPVMSRSLIYGGAKKVMSRIRGLKPFRILPPVRLQVRFTTASSVDRVLRMPGVERVNNLTIRFRGKDFLEAFKAFNTLSDLLELVTYI